MPSRRIEFDYVCVVRYCDAVFCRAVGTRLYELTLEAVVQKRQLEDVVEVGELWAY